MAGGQAGLTIVYAAGAPFLSDLDELRARSGFLCRVADRELAPGSAIDLTLEIPGGSAIVAATVIQAIAGQGVALSFDPNAAAVLALVATAKQRAGASRAGAPPRAARWNDLAETAETSETGEPSAPSAPEPPAPTAPTAPPRPTRRTSSHEAPVKERLKSASKNEKMQLALRGTRAERTALIRDRDKTLHQYVIRNPKLGLDEVAAIARMTTVAPDVLKFIADRRDWFQRPEVASGLCRNPKVSPVVAKRLLAFVSSHELRQFAKGNGVRESIAAEARRKLFRR